MWFNVLTVPLSAGLLLLLLLLSAVVPHSLCCRVSWQTSSGWLFVRMVVV